MSDDTIDPKDLTEEYLSKMLSTHELKSHIEMVEHLEGFSRGITLCAEHLESKGEYELAAELMIVTVGEYYFQQHLIKSGVDLNAVPVAEAASLIAAARTYMLEQLEILSVSMGPRKGDA